MPTLANIQGASLVQDPNAISSGVQAGAQLGNLIRQNRLQDEALAREEEGRGVVSGAIGGAMEGDMDKLVAIARIDQPLAQTLFSIQQTGNKAAATKLAQMNEEAGAFGASIVGKDPSFQRQQLLVKANEFKQSGNERMAQDYLDMANMAGTDPDALNSELQQDIALSGLTKDALGVFGLGGEAVSALDVAKTGKLETETKLLDQKFKSLSDPNAPTEDKVKIEKDLRQEVFNRSKDFEKVDDAWRRVEVSAQEPSAAGDMAMIFNYMKMLDPGSTVREGEFATAQQAGGVDDRTVSLYNSIIEGTRLSPKQRADFTKRAKSLYGVAKNKQDTLTKRYKGLAKRYGVDYENVILGIDKPELSDEDLLNKYGV